MKASTETGIPSRIFKRKPQFLGRLGMLPFLMKRPVHQNQLKLSNKTQVFKRSKEVKGMILSSPVCLHLLQNFRGTFKLETFSIA